MLLKLRGRKFCTKSKHECVNSVYHHAMSSGHAVYFFAVFFYAHGLYAWPALALGVGLVGGIFFKLDDGKEE